ncbi:MAG: hypothetical protein AB7K09_03935 [Planctomycetota bacterium]
MTRVVVWLGVLVALAAVSCCGCNNTSSNAGNAGKDAPTNDDAGAGNGNASNSSQPPPIERLLISPWPAARVGDTARYRTLRAPDGETWTLIDADTIRYTISATDAFGDPIDREEIKPVRRDDPDAWWNLPRDARRRVPGETIKLADGSEVETFIVKGTLDGRAVTLLVNPDAVPFDGVVRLTVDGAAQPERELLSFTRGE